MSVISNKDFVHWHCHSAYSMFDGLSQISEIDMEKERDNFALNARRMGFPALALTDHGNVGGWIKFIAACTATKDKTGKEIPYDPIKPILGSECYLSVNRHWKSKDDAKENGGYQKDGRQGNRHLNLYAMNWEGYQNLCTLSEKSFTEGYYFKDPRIDIELLSQHSNGLMCGSACLSSFINANLLNDRYDMAKAACTLIKDIFGENFFLEAQYHGIPEEKYIIPDILKLSRELSIPVLCTNDSHYIHKSQAMSQEVLMCISTSNCLSNPKHMHFPYEEFYLKSAEEMARIFGSVPHLLTNTVAMAERINTDDIAFHLFSGRMRLPEFKLPEGFTEPMQYLIHLAKEGAKRLGWDKSKPHIENLKKEINDIRIALENNGYDFPTYFLIVWDYVNYAREKGIITGCGRGSGYASLLLRCLGISYGPDPLEYGLFWERFLGFDTRRIMLEKDFGFPEKKSVVQIIESIEDNVDNLDDERSVEDDFGGVDRY